MYQENSFREYTVVSISDALILKRRVQFSYNCINIIGSFIYAAAVAVKGLRGLEQPLVAWDNKLFSKSKIYCHNLIYLKSSQTSN